MWVEHPPFWYRLLFPGALFREKPTDTKPGTVYITFDDGPEPKVTPRVLDTLDRYGIKATFFMVGENVSRHPMLFNEVVKRGHAIGNHTFHHVKGWKLGVKEYLKEIHEGEKITGSRLFRPPHGFLTPFQLRAVKRSHKVVMFDIVTRDYDFHITAPEILLIVKKYVRDGSIIVFHDSIKSFPRMENALPEVLDWLIEKGYKFEVIK